MRPDTEDLRKSMARGKVICRRGRISYSGEQYSLPKKVRTWSYSVGDEDIRICCGCDPDCYDRVEWREFDCEGNVHCRNIGNDRYYGAKAEALKRISDLERKLK